MFTISNYGERVVEGPNGDRVIRTHRDVRAIIQSLKDQTKSTTAPSGWPQVLEGGVLFVARKPDPDKVPDMAAITQIETPTQLWAWLGMKANRKWAEGEIELERGGGMVRAVTKEDLFFSLVMGGGSGFECVEQMPHEPEIPGVYYLERSLPDGNGKALEEFLHMLNPETEYDRHLMKAAILTTVAGLPPGSRPAFVFRARRQGSGKTATAATIGGVTGGCIALRPEQNGDRFLQAFFDKDSTGRRVVLLDNLKKPLDSALVESLITARNVQGHRMWVGRSSRPNHLTWFLTANRPKLSADMASRSVVIHVGRPVTGIDFERKMALFLSRKRMEVVADCVAILRSGKRYTMKPENRIRFYDWEELVLRRLKDCDLLGGIIKHRQGEVNVEADAGEDIREEIIAIMEKVKAPWREGSVFLDWNTVCKAVERATRSPRKMTKQEVSAIMRTLIGQGALKELEQYRNRRCGRGLVWRGADWDPYGEQVLPMVRILGGRLSAMDETE